MKGKAIFSVFLMTAWQAAQAEPVFMPQAASVLKSKQLEAGVGGQFGYQSSEIAGSAGTTFKNRVWHFPIMARYGVLDMLETHVEIPITRAVDSSEGLSSTRNAETGLGNIQMGTKWNFASAPLPLAVGLNLDLPTANSANNAAVTGRRYSTQKQLGFNTHLFAAADTPMMAELVTGHAVLGYMNTGTYTDVNDTRFNPSDLFTFGASLDMSLKRWVEGVSLSAEMVGNTALNHTKRNSTQGGNDKGTVLEVGPAVRYNVGRIRTHAGFLVDEGKSTFRAYNYRVNFGVSVLWGGH